MHLVSLQEPPMCNFQGYSKCGVWMGASWQTVTALPSDKKRNWEESFRIFLKRPNTNKKWDLHYFLCLCFIFLLFPPYEFIFQWICISLWQVEIKNQPQKVIHYHRYFERHSFSASGREGFPCMPVSWWQLPWVLFWEGSQSHELWSTGSATGPRLESGSMSQGRCHLRLSPVPPLNSLRNCGPEGRRDVPKSHWVWARAGAKTFPTTPCLLSSLPSLPQSWHP